MICDICYDDKKDMYMCKCGMHYCDSCILDIIVRYEFKCTNCNKHIKLNKLMELMTKENIVTLLISKYRINMSTFKSIWLKMFKYEVLKCNKCNNKLSYRKPNYYCEHCKEEVCFICLTNHYPCCNKTSLYEFNKYCEDVKPCPNCLIKIFKTKGCDDMYCTNCRTGFDWNSGKKFETYFENPERSNVLNHIGDYVEINNDIKEMYKSESYGYIISMYNLIVKHNSQLLDSISLILQSDSPFEIVNFMNYYINYKLKIKTLKVMHRNLYLYETIRETHLTLDETVYNLIDELLNLKYKYIDEITKSRLIKLPIVSKKELNELKEAGLYEYFINCIIKLHSKDEITMINKAGSKLLSKYYGKEILIPY